MFWVRLFVFIVLLVTDILGLTKVFHSPVQYVNTCIFLTKAHLLLVGCLWLVGCANHFPETHSPVITSSSKQLAVPFIVQDDAYCGPRH